MEGGKKYGLAKILEKGNMRKRLRRERRWMDKEREVRNKKTKTNRERRDDQKVRESICSDQ